MRSLGVIGIFALAFAGVGAVVACSSDDPGADPAPDAALPDAPIDPRQEGGVDGGADGGDLLTSGTRLKITGTETSEGAFVFGGVFDSKLGTACVTVRAEDGVRRCAPLAQVFAGFQFANDTCTADLATGPKGACIAPKVAARTIQGANPCDSLRETVQLGPEVTLTKVYQRDGTGACVEAIVAPDAAYYPVTKKLPATDLVALSEADVPVTTAVGVRVISGEDGSRFPIGAFVDRARGKACDINLAGDGKTRCTPRSSHSTGSSFSDALCSARVGLAAECIGPTEVFDDSTAATFELGSCSLNTIRAFPLGAKRATKESFSKDADGGCAGPITSTGDVFDLGPEIAPSTFPEIAFQATGGPRITEATYASGGALLYRRRTLRDTMLDVTCSFDKAADGKLRCLPSGSAGIAIQFADDQCKVRLGNEQASCGSVAKYILASEGAACALATHVYLVGAKLDPATTATWVLSGGTCIPFMGATSATAYLTLGAEVPASTFAEGKAATLP